MLAQVELSKTVGKTIIATDDFCEGVAMVFSDGTFAYFEAQSCYDSLSIEDDLLALRDIHSWHVDLGIATQQEVDEARKREEMACIASRDAADRRAYERLKAKFSD